MAYCTTVFSVWDGCMFHLSEHLSQLFNFNFHSSLSLHSTFSEFYALPIVYLKKEEEIVLEGMRGELHNTFV
jgi:hypothetical protein